MLKNNKGSIIIYSFVACMLLITIGISSYIMTNNKQASQLEELSQIQAKYNGIYSTSELKATFKGGEIVTIYTLAQFLQIGTNSELYIDGKLYNMVYGNTYILKGDFSENAQYVSKIESIRNAGGSVELYDNWNEFQEVGYIQSSGTQYIDTGVVSAGDVETDILFEYVSESTYNRVFGTTGTSGSQYGLRTSTTSGGMFYGELLLFGTVTTSIPMELNKKYDVIFNRNASFIINDVSISGFVLNSSVGSQNIYLFAHNNGVVQCSNIKLYECTLLKNNIMVRNFIPCYRKADNKPGLYDTVNHKFYTNAGTGDFTLGTTVINITTSEQFYKIGTNESVTIDGTSYIFGYNNKYVLKADFSEREDYITIIENIRINGGSVELYDNSYLFQEVDYIESTGTQYIDTGYIVNYTDLILEYKYRKTGSTLQENPLGVDLGGSSKQTHGNIYSNSGYYGNSLVVDSLIPEVLNQDYTVRFEINSTLGYGKWIVNNTEYYNSVSGLNGWNGALYSDYLFGTNAGGTASYKMTGRLYYVRYYKNNTELEREFIPVYRKSDNKPGMYDTVNHKFYTNAGTGEFTFV